MTTVWGTDPVRGGTQALRVLWLMACPCPPPAPGSGRAGNGRLAGGVGREHRLLLLLEHSEQRGDLGAATVPGDAGPGPAALPAQVGETPSPARGDDGALSPSPPFIPSPFPLQHRGRRQRQLRSGCRAVPPGEGGHPRQRRPWGQPHQAGGEEGQSDGLSTGFWLPWGL